MALPLSDTLSIRRIIRDSINTSMHLATYPVTCADASELFEQNSRHNHTQTHVMYVHYLAAPKYVRLAEVYFLVISSSQVLPRD